MLHKGTLTSVTSLQYLEEVDAILGTIEGDLSYQKYKESVEDLMRFPQYKPGMNVIWDLRGANSKSLTTHDVQLVASYSKTLDQSRGKWKAAMIVPGIVEFGLARMFQAWLDDAPFILYICRSMDEAKKWLKPSIHPEI
jgi:hypothetical protein